METGPHTAYKQSVWDGQKLDIQTYLGDFTNTLSGPEGYI